MPGYPGLLLPVIEIAAIVWLMSKIAYRRYPALLIYLALEAIAQTVAILARSWWVEALTFSQPIRMVVRTLVVYEVFRFACVQMNPARKLRLALSAAGVSLFGMGLTLAGTHLSPLQSFFVFRQYYHMLLAAALVGLCVHIWREPLMENRDHKVYRYAMTIQAACAFVGAAFVKGGFAHLVFPRTVRTWHTVDAVLWIAACVVVAGMAYGMTSNISCLRPDVAYNDDSWMEDAPNSPE